jgi:hypothetical protein
MKSTLSLLLRLGGNKFNHIVSFRFGCSYSQWTWRSAPTMSRLGHTYMIVNARPPVEREATSVKAGEKRLSTRRKTATTTCYNNSSQFPSSRSLVPSRSQNLLKYRLLSQRPRQLPPRHPYQLLPSTPRTPSRHGRGCLRSEPGRPQLLI